MGRRLRAAAGGLIDRALNRANARLAILAVEGDFSAFGRALTQSVSQFYMRLLAYRLIPNRLRTSTVDRASRRPSEAPVSALARRAVDEFLGRAGKVGRK